MSEISDEVMNKAVEVEYGGEIHAFPFEAVYKAARKIAIASGRDIEPGEEVPFWAWQGAKFALAAAAPIITDAAVKEERQRIESEVPRIKAEVNAAFDYPQAANIALGSVLAVVTKEEA